MSTLPEAELDVVVVTYESAESLPACVGALPASARVVVVDNTSGDASAEVAESLGARVVRAGANLGFAAAANRGATLGHAELVLFLNPDAVVDEATLGRLIAALREDERTAVVGPRLVSAEGVEERGAWPFPSPLRTWGEALALHRLRSSTPTANGVVPFVIGAVFLVRRAAFEAAGGFDERFWLYGEEADLCRRLAAAGWTVRHVPDATATHVGGASGSAARALSFEHFQRGTEHFIAKHYGRRGLVAHRLGLLTGTLLRLPLLALARGDAARVAGGTRRAMLARLVRVLATHPTRVGR